MATTDDRPAVDSGTGELHSTISGIEVELLYTAEDVELD